MSTRWRNFSSDDLRDIGALLPELGEFAPSQPCPSCGQDRVRWYHYLNPNRARSKISYVWCGYCRHYFGQTTLQQEWDLPDPYATKSAGQRLEMEADLDSYFEDLDRLWASGDLPQVRASRDVPRRSH